jgi:hypothetical protein
MKINTSEIMKDNKICIFNLKIPVEVLCYEDIENLELLLGQLGEFVNVKLGEFVNVKLEEVKCEELSFWEWSVRIASSVDDRENDRENDINGISAGPDGVYVTGYFYTTPLSFYNHQETNPKFYLENDDIYGITSDAFVAKIDKDGVW